jgi:hypothetical protein
MRSRRIGAELLLPYLTHGNFGLRAYRGWMHEQLCGRNSSRLLSTRHHVIPGWHWRDVRGDEGRDGRKPYGTAVSKEAVTPTGLEPVLPA